MMNPDATEFIPQHKHPVIDQIHNTLFAMVCDYFKDEDSKNLHSLAMKLVVILNHQGKLIDSVEKGPINVDVNVPIARCLIAISISRTNAVVAAMPYIREITNQLSDASYNALMQAIQNQIYLVIHSDRVKSILLQMSGGESINFRNEPFTNVNTDNIDILPIYIPELINLILEIITLMLEKRRQSEDALVPPNQICMDLLYIADSVFRLQMTNSPNQIAKELEANVSINGDDGKIDRKTYLANQNKKKGLTEWYEFFCLICEAVSKIVPIVNYTLLSSNESIQNGAWCYSASLSMRQDVLNQKIKECAFFSIPNLAALLDGTLTRLRELVVQPNYLNKWHARSSALDTLLAASSLSSISIPSAIESDYDDITPEDPSDDYTADYEKFLAALPK